VAGVGECGDRRCTFRLSCGSFLVGLIVFACLWWTCWMRVATWSTRNPSLIWSLFLCFWWGSKPVTWPFGRLKLWLAWDATFWAILHTRQNHWGKGKWVGGWGGFSQDCGCLTHNPVNLRGSWFLDDCLGVRHRRCHVWTWTWYLSACWSWLRLGSYWDCSYT
jgi:hypothetical protein